MSFETVNAAYEKALEEAFNAFKAHFTSNSPRWRALSTPAPANNKGKSKEFTNGIGSLDPSTVQIHSKAAPGGPILRAVAEVPCSEGASLDDWRAVLESDECHSSWNSLVEHAHTVEVLDSRTRISKTDYRLGWPSSPRDTVALSRTFRDPTTLINLSTSVPRSKDEPTFLRPAPPYVRSQLGLLAWCLQSLPSTSTAPARIKITLFWHWSVKLVTSQSLASLLVSLVEFVKTNGHLMPLLSGYGRCLVVSSSVFDQSSETLTVDYNILPEDSVEKQKESAQKTFDQLEQSKESKRLERKIELKLCPSQGWDVKLDVKPLSGAESSWSGALESSTTADDSHRHTLRLSHAALAKPEQSVNVRLTATRLAGGRGVRLDGKPIEPAQVEPRDPTTKFSLETDDKSATTNESGFESVASARNERERRSHNAVEALLRRNYIYFTSLLQEPEAKWRSSMDSSGVTVTQLDSIDPTLTIYRAEATFVGVGVWDIFATVANPYTRKFWDRNLEEATLLDDAGEGKLWWEKQAGRWPVAPRDSVTLRTAYKSPTAVHVLSFSTDDTSLFPTIPSAQYPVIRTQTSLYGWAIEALNPTTTQITLIDQSDPKGWSNKSWTPAGMVAAVSGVGDFALKFGGPPMITRLSNAKMTVSEYDHDKGSARTEYTPTVQGEGTIECEIRCDNKTWSPSIDLVVDPPPKTVTALARHRLSSGGGMWLTITHDALALSEERILISIRKGPAGRERGTLVVNGSKVKVDTEHLPEDEIKMLNQRKRIKASPIPLDQYPTHGPRLWRTSPNRSSPAPSPGVHVAEDPLGSIPNGTSDAAGKTTEQTRPSTSAQSNEPAAKALEALAWLQTFHAEQGPELTDPAPGWTIVTERTGTVVRKKLINGISDTLPVYRGDRIVQGLTAEEIKSIVSVPGCRQSWDERIESAIPLASFGRGLTTACLTTKPAFPFKGRIFHLATATAQVTVPSAAAGASTSTVCFVASASYVPSDEFEASLVNPSSLLPARVLLEGWILETLDPYTSSMLAIPSTRCTYVTCVDHSGSVPFALNSVLNANLAKLIGAVETLGKAKGPLPRVLTPDAVLQIEGALNDDNDETVWRLRPTSAQSVFIKSDFDVTTNSFEALFTTPRKQAREETAGKSESTNHIIKSELPRSASQTLGPSPSTATLKRQPSRPELARKQSAGSLLAPIANAPGATSANLIFAELVIDLKQFPAGYTIDCVGSTLSNSESAFSFDPLPTGSKIPVRASAYSAPLPSIISASLDSWKRGNHLIRFFVPTAEIESPVRDPLRDEKQKSEQPEWYKRLKEHGAVFRVKITAKPAQAGNNTVVATLNGETLQLRAIKDTKGVLARMEDEDDWHSSGAKISRTLRTSKDKGGKQEEKSTSNLPKDLVEPMAVAKRLFALPKTSTLTEGTISSDAYPDPKSPGAQTPNEDGAKSPHMTTKGGGSPSISRRETGTGESGGRPLLSILGGNTFSRIGSSMSVPQEKQFTMRFVLVVALVAFLIGSLLRSLLTPADYIIYRPLEEQGTHVERMLMQAFDPERRWREAKRLLELRGYGTGWDLIVAVVRRD